LVPGCKKKARRKSLESTTNSPVAKTTGKGDQSGKQEFFDEEIDDFVLSEKDEKNPFVEPVVSVGDSDTEDFEFEDEEETASLPEQKKGLKTVYYAFNQYKLTPDQKAGLELNVQEVKNSLKNDPSTQFVVEGHACRSAGSDSYNLALSNRRGAEYIHYLVQNNIPKKSLKLVGRGSEMPIVPTGNAEEQAPNRRVELYPTSPHKIV